MRWPVPPCCRSGRSPCRPRRSRGSMSRIAHVLDTRRCKYVVSAAMLPVVVIGLGVSVMPSPCVRLVTVRCFRPHPSRTSCPPVALRYLPVRAALRQLVTRRNVDRARAGDRIRTGAKAHARRHARDRPGAAASVVRARPRRTRSTSGPGRSRTSTGTARPTGARGAAIWSRLTASPGQNSR